MSGSHNDYQRSYYSSRPLPRMTVDQSSTAYVQRHVSEVISALGVPSGARILDMGCGLGKYTAALADRGFDVTGLDLTPALVEELSRLRPDIPVVLADAAEPPPELAEQFDAVTGFFFLHHLDVLAPVMEGVRTTLRRGGSAVFLEPNPIYLPYSLQITFTPGMTWRGEKGIFQMTRKRLEDSARRAGFSDVSFRSFGATPPALTNKPWGRRMEALIERIPGWSRLGAFRLIHLR
ncbi:MAG: methyltransferase domain-containing protein [Acidimicrobiia bacterium]